MTDKEIIIDRVDVSRCEHFIKCGSSDKEYKCKAITWLRYEDDYAYKENGYCYKCPNCYFKQLQRKTAECEKYEQALDEILQFTDLSIGYICFRCKNFKGCSECNVSKIKEIINKTKDGNNDK